MESAGARPDPFRRDRDDDHNDRGTGVVSAGPSLLIRCNGIQAAFTSFNLEMPSILSAAVS
jgi:hypothetical protein